MKTIPAAPGVPFETDSTAIAKSTRQPVSWVQDMMIDRRGDSAESNMTALGLHTVVTHNEYFRISGHEGLVPVDKTEEAIVLAAIDQNQTSNPPPHTVFQGNWDLGATLGRGTENLLGDNVTLTIEGDDTELSVPIVDATNNALNFYGARCLNDGDIVTFAFDHYPIWTMELGVDYVEDFILTEQGQGFYFEYHRDQPHWHQPISSDCGGIYYLAKKLSDIHETAQKYAITGFRIRPGTAVYTSPGAIHCDSALTGRTWVVGYRDSSDFSTALLRNDSSDMVRLSSATQ